MGYRSNIEVLCGSKIYQELHAVMTRHNWHPDSIQKVPDYNIFFIELCDYKWYDSYNNVQEFMQVLDDCSKHEGDSEYFYSFIRLGEERGDIETMENHDYCYPFCNHYPYVDTNKPLLEDIDELV